MPVAAAGTTAGADWRVQLADYASSRLKDEEVTRTGVEPACFRSLGCDVL